MSSLKEAERKLKENGFLFDDLPEDRSDPFWNHFMNDPYYLKLNEVCALKNARCKLPGISYNTIFSIIYFSFKCKFVFRYSRSSNSLFFSNEK